MPKRTYIYVDGLNLYYCAVKNTPYKWLDLKAVFQAVLAKENHIVKIKYYTANVSSIPDPGAPKRQKTFLDALRTIPEVDIYKGNFLVSEKWAPLAAPVSDLMRPPPKVVRILRTEEKGSDVNLASHLLWDAFRNEFDVAVVVSNDTDLVEPIRIVTQEMKIPVGIVCPNRGRRPPAQSLVQVASFVRHLRVKHLRTSQLPDPIPETTIRKPPTW